MQTIFHQTGRDAHYKIWNAPSEDMIIFFHNGEGSLVLADAIYPIEKGGICFIKGGKQRYTMPDNPSDYDRSKIYLSEEKRAHLFGALNPSDEFYKLFGSSSVVYAILPGEIQSVAEGYYKAAFESHSKESSDAIHLLSFFELLCLIFKYKQHNTRSPDGFMSRAVEYVNAHYTENIVLDDICRAVNVSKSYLCHKFKSVIGITVSEYVLKTRLSAAVGMLISTELSIGEVSSRCGFSSVSYFSQTFKLSYGVSAREYRKNSKM